MRFSFFYRIFLRQKSQQQHITIKRIGISLGFNCYPAVQGVIHGIRQRRSDGYSTCPFDMCVSNYDAVVDCIENDFADFTNPDYLEMVKIPFPPAFGKQWEKWICNTKYNILFNHESPGHGNLHIIEDWPNGKNHFVFDNFKEFIIRYNERIKNFFDYLLTPNHLITFIISNNITDTTALENVLKSKYPNLQYNFLKLAIPDGEVQSFKLYKKWCENRNKSSMYEYCIKWVNWIVQRVP
jgi:hypothetical protein